MPTWQKRTTLCPCTLQLRGGTQSFVTACMWLLWTKGHLPAYFSRSIPTTVDFILVNLFFLATSARHQLPYTDAVERGRIFIVLI